MSKTILIVVALNTIVSFSGLFLVYRHVNSTPQAVSVESAKAADAQVQPMQLDDFTVITVDKIIVSIAGEGREHYFVLDLVLYGDAKLEDSTVAKLEPLVRNSVVGALSAKAFQSLRAQSIGDIQQELETVIQRDFARLGIDAPFRHVLVNRLVVQ